jgi:hypothetical protein
VGSTSGVTHVGRLLSPHVLSFGSVTHERVAHTEQLIGSCRNACSDRAEYAPSARPLRWRDGNVLPFEMSRVRVPALQPGSAEAFRLATPCMESPVHSERCTPGSEGALGDRLGESRATDPGRLSPGPATPRMTRTMRNVRPSWALAWSERRSGGAGGRRRRTVVVAWGHGAP